MSFDRQIPSGTFEYTLCYLVDNEFELSLLDQRYRNDEQGRPPYDPAILLKTILLAYSRAVTNSRKMERLCRENVTFAALSADTQPHFTTIAQFISGCPGELEKPFTQVLMVCDAEGLIGREMFAIDGVKLPTNASKAWSGTHPFL